MNEQKKTTDFNAYRQKLKTDIFILMEASNFKILCQFMRLIQTLTKANPNLKTSIIATLLLEHEYLIAIPGFFFLLDDNPEKISLHRILNQNR